MEPLREMFRHHAWATLKLIDACMKLPAESLLVTAPGTYGPIHNTLVHLVGADQRYLKRLTGKLPESPLREGELPTLADLRTRFEANGPRWEALLDGVDELDVTIEAHGNWPETRHAENLMLVQAINHGNDHRTHICSVLTVLGVEAPDLDGWTYWAETYQKS
jgi:uncharacterized damage-inducible protein DinB